MFMRSFWRRSWCWMCFRGVRKRPDLPPSGFADKTKSLLDDSATYLDYQAAGEDAWTTSPYPGRNSFLKKAAEAMTEPKVDPELTSVVLFPGQGSQLVGMGRDLLKYPGVQTLYDTASAILGYDLQKLCLEGPKTDLDKTVNCQPAVFVTSLAAVHRLQDDFPLGVENCIACAGFSVGEYAALVFAGALDFEAGLRLVQARARAMQKASEECASGMMTVMQRADSELSLAIRAANSWMREQNVPSPVCQMANFLFPKCKVIAGNVEALNFIEKHAEEFRLGPRKRLLVSGAFHTSLMDPAVDALWSALHRTPISQPQIAVYSNLDAHPHPSDPKLIKKRLLKQLCRPVQWEQIMHNIYDRQREAGLPRTYELGPGTQLSTMLKRINTRAWHTCTAIKT